MPEDTQTPLQRQILARLREKGWSRRKLSLKAGLNESAVKTILSGKSQHPRHDTLEKLARELECTVEALLADAPAGQDSSAMAVDLREPSTASPIDEGLLFDVIEYVLDVLARVGGVIVSARTAEVILLVYGEMFEVEEADRREQLIATTKNVIRLTFRRDRFQ